MTESTRCSRLKTSTRPSPASRSSTALTLTVPAGEMHAIMGPNGAGKSTLAYVLGGRPGYEVTEGSVTFDGQDLLALEPHERAAAGLFLGFQYPVEIPGVSYLQFLRESLNSQRRARGEKDLSGAEFISSRRTRRRCSAWMPRCSSARSMSAFPAARRSAPRWSRWASWTRSFAILDETDSGLDIDALKAVGAGINRSCARPTKSVLLITHYQRLLDYVTARQVHVLSRGKIVRSRRARTGARARARRLCGGGGVRRVRPHLPIAGRGSRRGAAARVCDARADARFAGIEPAHAATHRLPPPRKGRGWMEAMTALPHPQAEKRIATPTSTRWRRCGTRLRDAANGSKLLRSKSCSKSGCRAAMTIAGSPRRNGARSGRGCAHFRAQQCAALTAASNST